MTNNDKDNGNGNGNVEAPETSKGNSVENVTVNGDACGEGKPSEGNAEKRLQSHPRDAHGHFTSRGTKTPQKPSDGGSTCYEEATPKAMRELAGKCSGKKAQDANKAAEMANENEDVKDEKDEKRYDNTVKEVSALIDEFFDTILHESRTNECDKRENEIPVSVARQAIDRTRKSCNETVEMFIKLVLSMSDEHAEELKKERRKRASMMEYMNTRITHTRFNFLAIGAFVATFLIMLGKMLMMVSR